MPVDLETHIANYLSYKIPNYINIVDDLTILNNQIIITFNNSATSSDEKAILKCIKSMKKQFSNELKS